MKQRPSGWLVVERKGTSEWGRSGHCATQKEAEEELKDLTPKLGGVLMVIPASASFAVKPLKRRMSRSVRRDRR